MRSIFFLTALFLLLSFLKGDAQSNYDLRFSNVSVDCNQEKLSVDLEVKAAVGQEFFLHNQNYRFSFDSLALDNPILVQELQASGFIDFGGGNLVLFAPHNLNGSIGNVVSYNVVVSGGDGYPLNDSVWIGIGTVQFDILDLESCGDLVWHRNDVGPFPATTLLASDNGMLYLLHDGTTSNRSACFVADCAAFEVQLENVETDCENSKVYVDIGIRSGVPSPEFLIADQSYKLAFDENVLSGPVIDQELFLSGQINSGGSISEYGPHTLNVSENGRIEYVVPLLSGNGYPVNSVSWTEVGRLVFDLQDPGSCTSLEWLTDDPSDFPGTIVSGLDPNQQTFEVNPFSFLDSDPCFEDCQLTDVGNVLLWEPEVFPTISSGPVFLKGSAYSMKKPFIIDLYDNTGILLNRLELESFPAETIMLFDLGNFPSGIYRIQLRSTHPLKTFSVLKGE